MSQSTEVPQPLDQEKHRASGWVWAGYIAAVFIPILGLVLAVPVSVRREYNHVVGIILLSIASFVVRFAVLAGSY